MADTKAQPSKYALVNLIITKLGIGDLGKVESFIIREIKKLERKLSAHNMNKKNLSFNHETTMEKLQDKLSDAKEDVEASYENIVPESIGNKASQSEFSKRYWEIIEEAESEVSIIEKAIEDEEETHSDALKAIEEDIEKTEYKIKKLSSSK